MDETQKHFVVRYLIARARLRPGRGAPSMTALEHEIAHGYKLLAGGVLVHPDANPPVTADDQDPEFFRAFIQGDDGAMPSTDPAELAAERRVERWSGAAPPRGSMMRRGAALVGQSERGGDHGQGSKGSKRSSVSVPLPAR
jgi:hypothetical protein